MMQDGVAYAFPGWGPLPALKLHSGLLPLPVGPDKGRLSETSRHSSPGGRLIQELGVGATAPDPHSMTYPMGLHQTIW